MVRTCTFFHCHYDISLALAFTVNSQNTPTCSTRGGSGPTLVRTCFRFCCGSKFLPIRSTAYKGSGYHTNWRFTYKVCGHRFFRGCLTYQVSGHPFLQTCLAYGHAVKVHPWVPHLQGRHYSVFCTFEASFYGLMIGLRSNELRNYLLRFFFASFFLATAVAFSACASFGLHKDGHFLRCCHPLLYFFYLALAHVLVLVLFTVGMRIAVMCLEETLQVGCLTYGASSAIKNKCFNVAWYCSMCSDD